MSLKICGHNRETLRLALRIKDSSGVTCGGGTASPDAAQSALVDAGDPAKLAAIIAELICGTGLIVGDGQAVAASGVHVFVITDVEMIHVTRGLYDWRGHKQLTMPKARAFTLALLDAPNATAQDVERMIGEL
jgi:hypothetical protein